MPFLKKSVKEGFKKKGKKKKEEVNIREEKKEAVWIGGAYFYAQTRRRTHLDPAQRSRANSA